MAPKNPSEPTSQTNIDPLGSTTSPKGRSVSSRLTDTAPTPTESDASVPDSSISRSQGPRGTSMQQKTVKPDGAGQAGKGSLKEAALKNVTMLGDPVSLKAETTDAGPTPEEDGAKAGRLKSKI